MPQYIDFKSNEVLLTWVEKDILHWQSKLSPVTK